MAPSQHIGFGLRSLLRAGLAASPAALSEQSVGKATLSREEEKPPERRLAVRGHVAWRTCLRVRQSDQRLQLRESPPQFICKRARQGPLSSRSAQGTYETRRVHDIMVAIGRCAGPLDIQGIAQFDEDLEGCPREENEGGPEQAAMEGKKGILSTLQHVRRNRFLRLDAQPGRIPVRIVSDDGSLFEAALSVLGHMNEGEMQVERVLAGGKNSLPQQLPDHFVHKKRVGSLVPGRFLANLVLDGVQMGLRRSPQGVEHKRAKKCLVHGRAALGRAEREYSLERPFHKSLLPSAATRRTVDEGGAMSKFIGPSRKTLGQPPGTLVHIGHVYDQRTMLTRIEYNAERVAESSPDPASALVHGLPDSVLWLDVDGVHDASAIEAIGASAGIHPLILEDVMHTGERPKLEESPGSLFVSLRMLRIAEATGQVEDEQVSLVLDRSWVISFQERQGDVFDPVRERIRGGRGRIRSAGADYLFCSLLDAVVDSYFGVLEDIGDRVEDVYESVTKNPTRAELDAIRMLKRELLFMRKAVWPLREVLSHLEHGGTSLLASDTLPYFRDVYDHAIQILDTIETYREMLTSLMDVYLSSIANRTNEVMKVLTMITTLFIPLTFLAGLYGMNFRFMPELEWRYGYYCLLAAMATVSTGMLIYFRKKRWL
jgi:magnesium transporter